MEIGLYFCGCGKGYVELNKVKKDYRCECRAKVILEQYPSRAQLVSLDTVQLKKLWRFFETIPYNDQEEITEPFFFWLKGTNRFAIWLWFEKQLRSEFIDLPGRLVWLEQGFAISRTCKCEHTLAAGQSCYLNRSNGDVYCDQCGQNKMLDIWLLSGYLNPWIRAAEDPFFNRESFVVCETMEQLIEKFQRGNWSLGQAFVYKNLCFINQVNAGDEWLTIKDYKPFESITFKAVLRHQDGQAYIQELLAYEIEGNHGPDYSLVEAIY
ncbi:hypothetical protein [Paenibacillus sp. MMO-58]|uniref:hypothetical protein n=1 Tax=Paenibacillus sp. MMO-58 TaxID=3081290 RepID=UPI00301742EC